MSERYDIDVDVPEEERQQMEETPIIDVFRGKWINAEVMAREIVKDLSATDDELVENFLYTMLDLMDELSIGQEILSDVVMGKTRKMTLYFSENPDDNKQPIQTTMSERYFADNYVELPSVFDYNETLPLDKNLDKLYMELNDPEKNPLKTNRHQKWLKKNIPNNFHDYMTYGDVVQTHGAFFIATKDGYKALNIS